MGARGYKGKTKEALALLRFAPEVSNAEIGRALGLSRERVRQIRARAGLLPMPKLASAPCRVCGKPSSDRSLQLCSMHLYREKHGIPLDAPLRKRRLCSDCGAVPSKVRGRCPKCARRADPAFHESERRRRAERAARAKNSSKISPGNA